jgi:hypothetical protein
MVSLTFLGVSAMAQSWQPERVVALEYPRHALVMGLAGAVKVECYVAHDGTVARAEPISGNEELASAAIRNALKWRFRRVNAGNDKYTLVYRFAILRGPKAQTVPGFRFVMPSNVYVSAVEILPQDSPK